MLNFLKPSNIQKLWASTGDMSPPPNDTKIAQGFIVEVPTLEDFNYIENRQDAMLAHINQRGIPAWDVGSDYLAAKSYVQGSNGIVYRAKLDHTGVDPVTDTTKTNWVPAFYSQGEVYTKTETHTNFAQSAANLSDLTDMSLARNNLQVYSSSQVNNFFTAKTNNLSDVTNPVTAFTNIKQQATEGTSGVLPIATYAETNAGTVPDKAVTPQKLRVGLTALFATNGYIMFPDWFFNLIIRWGTETLPANSQLVVSPLIAHSNIYAIICSDSGVGGGDMFSPKAGSSGTSITLTNTNSGSQQITWFAIGK